MNDKLNNNVTIIPPFKRFCMTIGELPTSYTESMTYYESLVWLCNYIQTTLIPAINNNGEAVTELQEKYVELKDYVDNYFENLDVQTEINNKLDEMADQGELAEIISAYLQMASVLGYDTKADLKAATNVISGSIAKTLGDSAYTTGDGHFYKIRDLEESDVIDDDVLVGLTNFAELVAEKIPDYYINSLDSRLDTLEETTIPGIEEEIENLSFKKWLFVGDSYSQGYTPDGDVTSWSTLLKSKMNLDSSTCIIADHGGAGFANTTYPYSQILTNLTADDEVTDVLIAGGYNDTYYPASEITTGISTCKTIINNKFPNAKIHIAFIGGTTNQYHRHILKTIGLYQDKCLELGIDYMPNLQYVLFNENLFSSDGIHPNQNGETAICNALYQALDKGYNYYKQVDLTIDTSTSTNFSQSSNITLTLRQNNNTSCLYSSSYVSLTTSTPFSIDNGAFIDIGTIEQNGLIGSYAYNSCFNIGNVIIHSTTSPAGYYTVPAQLFIQYNGKVYIKIMRHAGSDHAGYQTYGGCDNIQMDYFSINYLTDLL